MDEHGDVELLGGRPERVEPRCRQFLILGDARADLQAAEAEFVDAALHLLDGEIGVLQRHGAETDVALRRLLHLGGKPVVDRLRRLGAKAWFEAVVELLRAAGQRGNVDNHAVHVLEPRRHVDQCGGAVELLLLVLGCRRRRGQHRRGWPRRHCHMWLDEIVGLGDAQVDMDINRRRLGPDLLGQMLATGGRIIRAHGNVMGGHFSASFFLDLTVRVRAVPRLARSGPASPILPSIPRR